MLQYSSKVSWQSRLEPQFSCLEHQDIQVSRRKNRGSRNEEFTNMQTQKEVWGIDLLLEETTIAVHAQRFNIGTYNLHQSPAWALTTLNVFSLQFKQHQNIKSQFAWCSRINLVFRLHTYWEIQLQNTANETNTQMGIAKTTCYCNPQCYTTQYFWIWTSTVYMKL